MSEEINQDNNGIKKEKKKKHIVLRIFIILIILVTTICFYSKYYEVKNIKVKEYKIKDELIPLSFDGIKIVHFSDLNYGTTFYKDELQKLVEKINELKPDLVIFTGNLIHENYNYSKDDIDYIVESLLKIDSIIGKYAVRGVHDSKLTDYSINLANAGFTVLDNSYDLVYYKGFVPIYLAGLSSYLTTKIDLPKAFEYYKEPEDNTNQKEDPYKPIYKIVLVNESDATDEILSYDNTVNLILAGNSLGGSVRIPYLGALIKEDGSEKYFNDYYEINNTKIFVSSGLGTNKFGMRLFNYPSFNFYRLSVS